MIGFHSFQNWSVFLIAGAGLASMHFYGDNMPEQAGGVIGKVVSESLINSIGFLGATLLLLALFLTAISLVTSVSWLTVMDLTGMYTLRMIDRVRNRIDIWRDKREGEKVRIKRHETVQVKQKQLKKLKN